MINALPVWKEGGKEGKVYPGIISGPEREAISGYPLGRRQKREALVDYRHRGE